jgi:hypothetical protein
MSLSIESDNLVNSMTDLNEVNTLNGYSTSTIILLGLLFAVIAFLIKHKRVVGMAVSEMTDSSHLFVEIYFCFVANTRTFYL